MLKAKNIYLSFHTNITWNNSNSNYKQKLHQTTMKTKKTIKKQLFVLFLALSLSIYFWSPGINAQPHYNYYAYNQTGNKPGKPDTTQLSNQSKVQVHVSENKEVLKDKGYYMSFVSLGLLPGSQDVITITPVSLDMSHGFYDPTGLFIGGGLAVETFDPSLMPLFFDIRGFFTKGNVKPWIGAKLGYAIPLSSRQNYHEKGGAYAGAGGGMIFSISNRAAFYFYLGYRYQKLTSTTTDYLGNEIKLITEFNRMEFRLGLSFH